MSGRRGNDRTEPFVASKEISSMKQRTSSLRSILGAAAAAAALVAALGAAPASAAPAPSWNLTSLPTPTNFVPGDTEGDYTYDVRVANVGAANTDGSEVTIVDTLPEGLEVSSVELPLRLAGVEPSSNPFDLGFLFCIPSAGPPPTVTCTLPEGDFPPTTGEHAVVVPEEEVRVVIHVSVPAGTPPGPLTNEVAVSGGGAPAATVVSHNQTTSGEDPQPAPGGFSFYQAGLAGPAGEEIGQAGAHPYGYTTNFAVNTNPAPSCGGCQTPFVPAGGALKDTPVALPPGLVGNPNVASKCTAQNFNTLHNLDLAPGVFAPTNACPDSSVIGTVHLQQVEGQPGIGVVPLYNLVPAPGMPAQFGFQVVGVPFYIETEVRPEDDYRIVAVLRNASQAKRVTSASITIWGTPADPLHDANRGSCLSTDPSQVPFSLGDCPAGLAAKPLLRLPTSCGSPLAIAMSFTTWNGTGPFSATDTHPAPAGCAQVPFEPSLEARPTTDVADSPTGLHADLHIAQPQDPATPGEADLRKTVVSLPEGLTINPSGANGLGSCSEAQVGYMGKAGGTDRFSNAPADCPDAAKIGTAEVNTPLVDHPLPGTVYVATPHANPFDSLLAIYIAINDPKSGIVVKLAGHVEPNLSTGQLTATFDGTPQVPFEDFKLEFFGGPRAALRSPATCGPKSTDSLLTPWSAPQGASVTSVDNYSIDRSPGGGPCPGSAGALPNGASFQAGTEAPVAGAYSPMVINLSRADGSQEFAQLTLTPPPGLLARLAGIPYCPEAAIAAARSKSGNEEETSPSCTAASRVGTVRVGAGAGSSPYYTSGSAYLAGPYKGAPLSLVIITPAVAGPYDLGTVVVRSAVHVNPVTAQITAVTDTIPGILEGIPLDVRSIAVRLDHPGWGLNPTSCEPTVFGGAFISTLNQSAALADRFQVGGCRQLGLKPRLYTRLFGGTKRGAHPKLRAVLMPRAGNANLTRAAVSLPRSEFLDQANIRTVCTRVQFAANACPKGAIYGRAVAETPLLDQPLQGPVYLRSSNNKLPDLVLDLHGQIDIEASARIDSKNKGIRTTFEAIPDAPLSKVVLYMKGGKKQGLLVNSRDICDGNYRASANLKGHNGRKRALNPKLKNSKCKKGMKGKKKRK